MRSSRGTSTTSTSRGPMPNPIPEVLRPESKIITLDNLVDHNSVVLDEANDDPKKAEIEAWLSKQIGTAIVKRYPGREWRVGVSVEARQIIIQCPQLSSRKGYHLLFMDRTSHQLVERAVKAAGEILEMYSVTRAHKPVDGEIQDLPLHPVHAEVISGDAQVDDVTYSGGSKIAT